MSGAAQPRDWQATALAHSDNVATVLCAVDAGERVIVRTSAGDVEITALEPIALCHKIALSDVAIGEAIVKYGEIIGEATTSIRRGAWVHVHNLRSRRGRATASKP
jgi:altronate dehydratase small subunit